MSTPATTSLENVNRSRLFVGICWALVPTAASFAILGDILGPLKSEFILSNYEVGLIGGAALWGMAISQILLGPLADLGMRRLMRVAAVCHTAGLTVMLLASPLTAAQSDTAFWLLFSGAIIIALGNGIVEVAGNPLVTSLYPEDKTSHLNKFHVWFPGGMVIAGLASYFLSQFGWGTWEARLALVYIPIVVYVVLLLWEPFPETEGKAAGVSIGEMFKATFTSPLFILLLFCMMITASLELGPMRWIPAVLESGGIPGILVLVWISGLMAVLRYNAGPIVHRVSPTGMLFGCAVIVGIGLFLFSYAETATMAFVTATVFAVGVSFFWPTMLGVVNERIPRSGALGMALMGGTGMAIVGLVTIPIMGEIADQYAPAQLPEQRTVETLRQTTETFPEQIQQMPESFRPDAQAAVSAAENVLEEYEGGELPAIATANALRAITSSGVESPLVGQAQQLLGPAENYGGRISFRYVAPLALIIALVFGVLYWRDQRRGGYKAKQLAREPKEEERVAADR